ncbi:MAG: hypothetical protein QOE11_1815 [Solirubrobacteraceae bacterium]|nr:hypothetical protein [Solirubrobacteraceae bacterium]
MQQIGAQLPAGDGVGRFNHLYLSVTEDVAGVVGAEFEDPAFLAELDVAFAALYFAAVDAAAGRRRVTHAWAPLFAARRRHGIAPIQFALAGMNAHINRDLAVALAATAHRRGLTLADDTPQHRDYERVNKVLQAVEKRIKAEYATGLIGVSDHVLGRLDDVVAMWCVTAARDAAWTHAKTLAALEGHHLLRTRFVDTLDQMVGFAGRGLLVPLLDV